MPVPWNPNHPAVFVEPPTGLPVSLVRHDGYPYEEVWDEAGTGWDGLFDIANRYLALANTRLGLPPEWLADLLSAPSISTAPKTALYWLRDRTDPRHSYWVTRQAGLDAASRPKIGTVLDRTAVLLAGLWFSGPDSVSLQPLFGGQGLRVLVQMGPSAVSNLIRITGVASTLPQPPIERMFTAMLEHASERIARTFALPEEIEVVDVGWRLPSEHEKLSPILFAKTAIPNRYGDDDNPYEKTSYLLVMRVNDKFPDGLEPLARRPLVASADADVFVQDPISRNGAKHHAINVDCVPIMDVIDEFGVPDYMKIDIEGNDRICISGLTNATAPRYVSIEMDHFAGERDLHILARLGYQDFKVICQNNSWHQVTTRNIWSYEWPPDNFIIRRLRRLRAAPSRIFAGRRYGESGPWGEKTSGVWHSVDHAHSVWRSLHELDERQGTHGLGWWFDIHAKK